MLIIVAKVSKISAKCFGSMMMRLYIIIAFTIFHFIASNRIIRMLIMGINYFLNLLFTFNVYVFYFSLLRYFMIARILKQ